MMDTIFRVWSDSFEDGKPIPEGFAFAKPDPMGKEHTLPAGNRNPQIAWSNPPLGTKSLIVICEDNDVPADFSKANVEGETIPADAPRTSFIHWVLVDIVPEEPCIDAATLSKGKEDRLAPTACVKGSTTIPKPSKTIRTTRGIITDTTVLAPRGTMNAYIATSLPSTQWISRCCLSKAISTAEMSKKP